MSSFRPPENPYGAGFARPCNTAVGKDAFLNSTRTSQSWPQRHVMVGGYYPVDHHTEPFFSLKVQVTTLHRPSKTPPEQQEAPGKGVNDQENPAPEAPHAVLPCSCLSLSRRTLNLAARTIRAHRKNTSSRWRRLDHAQQALLVLVHLHKGETFTQVAASFEVGTTTA